MRIILQNAFVTTNEVNICFVTVQAVCVCCLILYTKTASPIFFRNCDNKNEAFWRPVFLFTELPIGSEEFVNCHPFTAADSCGRQWILIHNGTVFESEHLNRYVFRQRGETDSERILLYIIDKINEASDIAKRPLTSGERFTLLDKIVCGSSPKNKLNLLIYDGELLYAHTNFKDSLYEKLDHFGTTFSTCPLTGEGWQELPLTTLTAYHEGRRVFTGTNHQHEYFFDPSSYKPLFLAYSGL